jgi:CheY-like chemotaxis protein
MVLEKEGIRLELELPPEPLWIRCDPLRLSQVVVNLLANALKFSDDGGPVTVSLRRDERTRMAVLSVRDRGVGIAPDAIPRLFQPFSQADPRHERGRGGLGLGLALVRALVEAHGGSVEARSDGPGRGAEFLAYLPLLAREPASRAAPPSPERATPVTPRSVLIVEDNWDAAEALRSVIELAGHTVEVAPDGKTGLAKARTLRPEVILCDIGLPIGMDGYAVAAAIRRDPDAYGSPYLVAVTGYGQPGDKARALEAGFDQHLTKGERPRALTTLLANLPSRP